jgi:predicted glycosyl hydrolase (DUF1957 family)
MYGHVWITGPNIVIRYYEARPRNGDRIPICAVLRSGPAGLKKLPNSPPGVALIDVSRAAAWIVDDFR